MSGEKTEDPTDHKLKKAKEKGQQAYSKDLASACALLGALLGMRLAQGWIHQHLTATFDLALRQAGDGPDAMSWSSLLLGLGAQSMLAILPVVLLAVLFGWLGAAAQVGFGVTIEPILPDLAKINPADGFQKLFSLDSAMEVVKAVVKAAAILLVAYGMHADLLRQAAAASMASPLGGLTVALTALRALLESCALALLVLGGLDIFLQRFLFRRKQKMSVDDLKQEHKEKEGDPLIKGMRRRVAFEISREPLRPRVDGLPRASVLVTNPTHFAVALEYDLQAAPVPRVVDKGADEHALRLRRVADSLGIPIVEDPPTARALHLLSVGQSIPAELYEPVARILAWLAGLPQVRPGHAPEAT